VSDAEAIVRDLAALDCFVTIPVATDETAIICITCDVMDFTDLRLFGRGQWTHIDHDSTCPWRRAREWIAAHPNPVPRPAGNDESAP